MEERTTEEQQSRLFNDLVNIVVRSGTGSIIYATGSHTSKPEFTDEICRIDRIPRDHSGWQSVRCDNKRYQLFGGIRTALFICLNSPIVPKPSYY